ncbi:MAG: hypothetical protein LC808_05495 [Actinobacteria bacterium]|nr:hypothetical protein [Actinomycetota bacterium]
MAAGLLLMAVLVSGCVQEAQEGGTLPPLASPTVSPSASPSPTPTGSDPEQIIALSKDYFAETNKALNSGDTTRLRSLFVPGCTSCKKSAAYIERHWAAGSIKAPGYWQVQQVSEALVVSPNNGHSNVVFTTGKEVRLDASGRTIKVNPANPKPAAASMSFVKVNGRWKVSRIVIHT